MRLVKVTDPAIRLDRAVLARWNRLLSKQANGCWIWTGTNTADGYARWRYKPGAREMFVHVWAYLAFIGPIPEGMQVDHRCHTDAVAKSECAGGDACEHRRCCNPDHLETVTPSENTLRQRHHNRGKTECPKGHPLEGANLIVWKDGKRRCRTCMGR
jgi:HNH endonuclease